MGILAQLAYVEEMSASKDRDNRQKLRILAGDVKSKLATVCALEAAFFVPTRNHDR